MSKFQKIDDNTLEKINGGIAESGDGEETVNDPKKQLMLVACQYCGKPFEADVQKDAVVCPHCKRPNYFYG